MVLAGAVLFGAVMVSATGCRKPAPEPGGAAVTAPAATRSLTIWWAQWAPADGLQELAREFARQENVDVTVHQIPWANFQDQVFQEFGKSQTSFDIVVGDSQWLGRGATRCLNVEITACLPSAVAIGSLNPV